jgi:hypothetical protein
MPRDFPDRRNAALVGRRLALLFTFGTVQVAQASFWPAGCRPLEPKAATWNCVWAWWHDRSGLMPVRLREFLSQLSGDRLFFKDGAVRCAWSWFWFPFWTVSSDRVVFGWARPCGALRWGRRRVVFTGDHGE